MLYVEFVLYFIFIMMKLKKNNLNNIIFDSFMLLVLLILIFELLCNVMWVTYPLLFDLREVETRSKNKMDLTSKLHVFSDSVCP